MDIKELLKRCIRILHIARKPTNEEYTTVAKVAAAGIVVFGIAGLVISMLMGFIR